MDTKPKEKVKGFRWHGGLRLAICIAALALAYSIKMLCPGFGEAAAHCINSGMSCGEVIALFGESVSSAEAAERLWEGSVVEVFSFREP